MSDNNNVTDAPILDLSNFEDKFAGQILAFVKSGMPYDKAVETVRETVVLGVALETIERKTSFTTASQRAKFLETVNKFAAVILDNVNSVEGDEDSKRKDARCPRHMIALDTPSGTIHIRLVANV